MTMLTPDAALRRHRQPKRLRSESLIDLYQDAPYKALLSAAIALQSLQDLEAQFGPAPRNLRKPLQPIMLYGAILADIRDFLKFRFHCKGLTGDEPGPSPRMQEGLTTGNIGEALEEPQMDISEWAELSGLSGEEAIQLKQSQSQYPSWPAVSYLVNYVVTALDDLSRRTTINREEFTNSVRRLRDILRAMVRWAYPEALGGHERYDDIDRRIFEDTTT